MAGDRWICLVSKSALTKTVLSLVVFVIFTFIAVEIKRIWDLSEMVYKDYLDMKEQFSSETVPRSTSSPAVSATRATNRSLVPQEYISVMESKPRCSKKQFLLILITSAIENFERRKAIRESWGKLSNSEVKSVFLIGQSKNRFLNVMVENEFVVSEDLLVGNYMDTYRNLTLKVLDGLRWALESCDAVYVLKTDDDCFVNVPFLLKFLRKDTTSKTGLYVGHIRRKASVVRDQNSRWYVSRRDYGPPCYAQYASGAGYIMSKDVLAKLIAFSAEITPFPNEDAYVGQVLHLARISPTNSARFVSSSSIESWKLCNYSYLFVIHPVKESMQMKMQRNVERALSLCPPPSTFESWK